MTGQLWLQILQSYIMVYRCTSGTNQSHDSHSFHSTYVQQIAEEDNRALKERKSFNLMIMYYAFKFSASMSHKKDMTVLLLNFVWFLAVETWGWKQIKNQPLISFKQLFKQTNY